MLRSLSNSRQNFRFDQGLLDAFAKDKLIEINKESSKSETEAEVKLEAELDRQFRKQANVKMNELKQPEQSFPVGVIDD